MVDAGILDEDERVELIGGELVPMSPKGARHELVKVALNRRWMRAAPSDCGVAQETTFRLSPDTSLEPDFVIYPQESGLLALSAETVLLVIEIADSSKRYDARRKAKLYAGFGVRELWVIDAVKLTTRVFLSPLTKGYAELHDHRATALVKPVFAPEAFALRLKDLELK
jgi:Uma2 family endonuclease